ncbi:hypothetical protein LUR56_16630 [Streptomyces sp. MT29]|nr:hypothetical protein [Streptomyces sp. MT29]
MSGTEEGSLLIAFPAAGSGGTTMEQLEKLAALRGMGFLALKNPPSDEAVESGSWQRDCLDQVSGALQADGGGPTLLAGHCMGGFSALRLRDELTAHTGRPAPVLLLNTPCPDGQGRIPTMSALTATRSPRSWPTRGFRRTSWTTRTYGRRSQSGCGRRPRSPTASSGGCTPAVPCRTSCTSCPPAATSSSRPGTASPGTNASPARST